MPPFLKSSTSTFRPTLATVDQPGHEQSTNPTDRNALVIETIAVPGRRLLCIEMGNNHERDPVDNLHVNRDGIRILNQVRRYCNDAGDSHNELRECSQMILERDSMMINQREEIRTISP